MSAIISQCGQYRYRLDREVPRDRPVNGSLVFAYFGVNPSTANASIDDATVRKWRGFGKRWGATRFIVGNAFAYRATDVRALSTVQAVGPENDRYLAEIIAEADILVPCWGDRGKVPAHLRNRFDAVLAALSASGKPVVTFGLTKGGDPKHPLMLSYETQLIPWRAEGNRAPIDVHQQEGS
ncbi:DUF1643 domain-containing protein [Paraburkholderia sp. A3BS-1L]|uniref:DUF1643 domain-containing protein n=1 Tax=Paraburkholderia sp. A3BS-1L TaxID=3028375 RepID=UPI003DA81342